MTKEQLKEVLEIQRDAPQVLQRLESLIPCLDRLAKGPDKIATGQTVVDVALVEHLRRAIPGLQTLWREWVPPEPKVTH